MHTTSCTRRPRRAARSVALLAWALAAAGLLAGPGAQAAPAAAASAPKAKVPKPAASAAASVAGKGGPKVTPPKWREKMAMPPSAHVATGMPGAGNLALRDAKARPAKLVDLNSASLAELKTLPGVGDAEAQRIVAGRPYRVKTDLVEKNVLPMGPFVSLRHHVIAATPPGAPGTGKITPAGKAGSNTASAKPAASAARPAGKT